MQPNPIETEGIREIIRFAVARIVNRAYPTLFTRASRIDNLFVEQNLRGRVVPMIATLGLETERDARSLTVQDLSEAIRHSGDPKVVATTRMYVVLTELYHYAIPNICSYSREWLNPWETWKLYLVPPMEEGECAYIQACANLLNTSYDEIYDQLITSNTTIGDSLRCYANQLMSGKNPDIPCLNRSEECEPELFLNRLRVYLHGGKCTWRRKWLGFQVTDSTDAVWK